MIDTIMLFAAGRGNRMRHLTENSPKSLIKVLEKPILHYSMQMCMLYPFKKIVINTHYMHEQIMQSVNEFIDAHPKLPEIHMIYEEELLETGGAIKNAVHLLGEKPIFTLNTDTIIRAGENIFDNMINRWDEETMDFLLFMQAHSGAVGYSGLGDFELGKNGRISRPDIEGNYSYMYSGLQILKPQKVAKNPQKIFSLREYYFNSDKVFGMTVPDSKWYHATQPEDIVDIEFNMIANESPGQR